MPFRLELERTLVGACAKIEVPVFQLSCRLPTVGVGTSTPWRVGVVLCGREFIVFTFPS